MAFSCMNGRLRQLPTPTDTIISIVPLLLPSGIITTHDLNDSATVTRSKTHFSLLKVREMHRRRGESIVDHCWSLLPSAMNETNDSKYEKCAVGTVLAILTRGKGGFGSKASSVYIYYQSHSSPIESNYVDTCYPLVKTLSFHCFCNAISMDREVFAVITSSGIEVYNLLNIVTNDKS